MKKQAKKGFTLIELMVVIVIIGILSALAIPKMLGVSAKAKAAEPLPILANYETLQSSYYQEKGVLGDSTAIGWSGSGSTWFTYLATTNTKVQAIVKKTFGDCTLTTDFWTSTPDATASAFTHLAPVTGKCAAYTSNF